MHRNRFTLMVALVSLLVLNGCATTEKELDPRDPWEGWNRNVQSFNDSLDDHLMKPVAKGYRWIMPSFVDRAVSNFFSNIDDIGVAINDVLQGKFIQSGSDSARFLVNSTLGVGGLIDVSSMLDLNKHNEDFGQTLGYWGVPTGPYLVLPFFGPSSPRGVAGLVGDAAMNPVTYLGIYLSSPAGSIVSSSLFMLNAVDKRADNLGMEKVATEAALDRYVFFRDAYLSHRRYLVLDGNVPEDDLLDEDFDFEDEDTSPTPPVNPY